MSKMRMFKFWNETGDEQEKEAMSLKKAIMSVQSNFKDRMISVEYISKKVNPHIKPLYVLFGLIIGRIFLPPIIFPPIKEKLSNNQIAITIYKI